MTDPRDDLIEQQRITIERQDAYIKSLDTPTETQRYATQRQFENALMIMTCGAVVALIVVAVRVTGFDITGWLIWFAIMLLIGIVAFAVMWWFKRVRR